MFNFSFIIKARKLQEAGAVGGIVIDNATDSSVITSRAFSMSDDGVDDVSIPLVFLFASEARPLLDMLDVNPDVLVTISELPKGIYCILLIVICSVLRIIKIIYFRN